MYIFLAILAYAFIGLNVGRIVYLDHGGNDISIVFIGLIAWPLVVLGFCLIKSIEILEFIFSSHFLTKYVCCLGNWFYNRFCR